MTGDSAPARPVRYRLFVVLTIALTSAVWIPADLSGQETDKENAKGESVAVKGATGTAERIREQRWKNILTGKIPGIAQDKPPPSEPVGQSGSEPGFPPPPDCTQADETTVGAYQGALREYYNYRKSGLIHRQRVFEWQHYSSIAIFFVVLVLVGVGIYFAAIQFHRELGRASPEGKSEPVKSTELEASLQGVKVSSPILGVIILVISLAFFYLYLTFVYPIHEVF